GEKGSMSAVPQGGRAAAGTAADRDEFVRAWARGIVKAGTARVDRRRLERLLGGLADGLIGALHDDPFQPATGHEIGAALATAEPVTPDALARTMMLFGVHLAGRVRPGGPDPGYRVAEIQGAVATGYA